MAEQVDPRDEADAGGPARLGDRLDLFGRESRRVGHFGPLRELEAVVDFEDQDVDALLGQGLLDEAKGEREVLGGGRGEMEAADREDWGTQRGGPKRHERQAEQSHAETIACRRRGATLRIWAWRRR